MSQPLLLLGAEHSLYTGKLRSYLRWKRVAHEAATSTGETYQAVILPKVGWGVVPVCVTPDGAVLQDTSVVMDHFEALQPHVRPVVPSGPRQRAAAAIVELFGDEFLKLAAMHYRWSFPEQRHFLRHEWNRAMNRDAHAKATPEERAAQLMACEKAMSRFAGSLPVLGVTPETIPGIEISTKRFLGNFDAHLAQHRYVLGDAPCIGDFGLMGPLYAHLARDPVPGRMVKCEFPCVSEWVERMYGSCFEGAERPQRVDQEGRVVVEARLESWLAEDEVPATLLPILGQFFEEHAPILVATVQALRQRVRASSAKDLAKEIPRAIGQTDFVVGGSHGRGKVLMAFDAWKTQRVLDALSPESREWLARTFGPAASAFLALDMSDVRLVKKAGPNRGSTVYLREYCAADGRSHL